jgi:hypothetical protein
VLNLAPLSKKLLAISFFDRDQLVALIIAIALVFPIGKSNQIKSNQIKLNKLGGRELREKFLPSLNCLKLNRR